MAIKRITQLPPGTPTQTKQMMMDLATAEKASIKDIVYSGRPAASQSEAEVGTDADKVMTPVAVKQSIASEVGDTLASASQGALAGTALQPADIGSSIQAFSPNLTALSGTAPGAAGLSVLSQATNTDVRNLLQVGVLNPLWYLAVGNGITRDTSKFTDLEAAFTGRLVDLLGKTYAVSAIPTGNLYTNGNWAGPFENFANSSDLSQSTWGKQRVTISGTALAIPTAVNGSHYVETPIIPVSDAYPFWFRVDGKPDGYSILRIRLSNSSGTLISEARVNLSTGAIIAGTNVTISAPDGGGYRRVDVPFTITSGITSVRAQLWIYNDADQGTFTGDGTSGISMRNLAWGNIPYSSALDGSIIPSVADTGGLQTPYTGGTLVPLLPTVSGRSTPTNIGILWSQNCRAEFVRAVCVGSIYSHSKGNVSGNYSARECFSLVPQSVNIASEECGIWGGFRGLNGAAFTSFCEGESNFNIGTRGSYAGGRNAGNIGSTGAYAGRGGGAKLAVTTVAGVVTGFTVERSGSRYLVGDAIVPMDRSGAGTGASAVVSSVDAAGGITGIGSIVGGSGYSSNVDAFVDNGTGDFSGNLFNAGFTETSGEASVVMASLGGSGGYVKASGNRSVVMASEGPSEASGNMSVVMASSGGVASGLISAAIAVNNSKASAQESIVFGRRTENPEVRSLAGGDAASGGPLSANRKWSISNATGLIKSVLATSVGTFADFAEYFPNITGAEIPVGTIVQVNGEGVEPWDGSFRIAGVVSATAAFIAGDSHFTWAGRYLYDEFGRPVMVEGVDEDTGETVMVQAENPEYNPDIANVARSERPDEWSCVGIVGQVFTRVPKATKPNDMIGDRLEVMKITTPFNRKKGYAVAKCFIR